MQFSWRRTKKVGRGDWRITKSRSSEFELSEDTRTLHESRGVLELLQVSLCFGPKKSWRRSVSFVHCSGSFQLTQFRCGEVSLSDVDNSFACVHGPSMADCVWPWMTETGEYDGTCIAEKWLIGDRDYRFETNPGREGDKIMHHTRDSISIVSHPNVITSKHVSSSILPCIWSGHVCRCSDFWCIFTSKMCRLGGSFAQDSNRILRMARESRLNFR